MTEKAPKQSGASGASTRRQHDVCGPVCESPGRRPPPRWCRGAGHGGCGIRTGEPGARGDVAGDRSADTGSASEGLTLRILRSGTSGTPFGIGDSAQCRSHTHPDAIAVFRSGTSMASSIASRAAATPYWEKRSKRFAGLSPHSSGMKSRPRQRSGCGRARIEAGELADRRKAGFQPAHNRRPDPRGRHASHAVNDDGSHAASARRLHPASVREAMP